MGIIKIIISIIISYFIGSIPFSYIFCKKIKNIDIRTVGSKNAGATNAARVLGRKWFFIITLLDAFKGFVTILIVQYLTKGGIIAQHSLIPILTGSSAIFGHTFSPYLNFKGGKGVAISAGVLLALDFRLLLIGIPVFILTVFISKYISLGSMLGAISIPLSIIFLYKKEDDHIYLLCFGFIIALYVIYKHIENIKSIISGRERKWNKKNISV